MNDTTTSQTDWTVGQLLNWTSDFLRENGSLEPRLDAEVLLANVRNCSRIELYTDFDQVVTPEVRTAFRELVRQRAAGTPVAYLVGHREFYSLPFEVNSDVLIPRPETELLIVSLLDLIKNRSTGERTHQIADLGTGSGVIAICAAKHVTDCHVVAVDVSQVALRVAERNAARHHVAQRITFAHSDLFEQIPAEQTFDFILSNPPYVSEEEYRSLATDVRDHEPRQALVAGDTGTEVIQRVISQSATRLRQSGLLMIEISPMIEQQVRELMEEEPGLSDVRIIKDLAGLSRICQSEAS